MKKITCVLLALLLTLALAAPALADIAYEPRDNFYEKHRKDCDYENRVWFTAGGEGYVTVYSSPTGSARTAIANGSAFYVSYTYDAGRWGCIEYDPDTQQNAFQNTVSGWVKMEEMVCDYDSRAFTEDHTDELVKEERTLRPDPEAGEVLYTYTYPGSGEVRNTFHTDMMEDQEMSFSQVFTDPAGRDWGYCGYHYGIRELWVCLDDPYNGELEADENFVDPLAKVNPAADPSAVKAAARAAGLPNAYLIAGVGGVVVIAAAILAAVIRKKKKA